MKFYTRSATSDTPAHIVYLLDASGSMTHNLEGRPRSKWMEQALQLAIDKMISRSEEGEIYHERYKVSVITYSSDINNDLTGDGFVDVREFVEDGYPNIDPGGETNTLKAFEKAYEILERLLRNTNVQEQCPAPLVCHVTDGEFNRGDPSNIVKKIKQLRNKDGNVLVQNLFISDMLLVAPIADVTMWTGFRSEDANKIFTNDYARYLFEMSSELPESYASVLQDYKYALHAGSKMMYPGQSSELIKLAFVASMSTPFK